MRFRNASLLAAVLFVSLLSYATPQVTSTSPAAGPVGTQVQVYGGGFGASQGSSTVAFSGANAAVTSWSDGQITATVPSAAITGPVTVTVGVASNANVYFSVPPPVISSISPTSGVAGTQVTVTGSGFGPSKGSSSVLIGGVAANTVTSWSATQFVATVPNSATTGPVSVTVNNVTSNLDVLFTMPNPVISSLSPTSGPVGTQVQINGSGFGATPGSSTVTFYGVGASIVSWSNTQIVATVPPAATTGAVTVTVAAIASNGNIYFAVPAPKVTSISPASGQQGTQVTVSGSGFQATQGSSSIVFNGRSATVNSWSDTQIVATVGAGTSTGPVKVTVNGVVSNQDVVFTTPNPIVTGISPVSGPGGTQVQINGVSFGATQGSSTVTIASYPASIVSWSNTQIVATTVSYAVTGAATVTVAAVTSNNDIIFTVPAPQITSISPTNGVVGTQVTITGSNFPATSSYSYVAFSGQTASTSSWSGTQIVATVPSYAASGPVTVSLNGGITSNENVKFTVPSPLIASVSPTSGPVGTQVQVNGSGFGATQGSNTLTFNSTGATVVSWSDTQIVATVPAAAASGPVKVVEGGIASNTSVIYTVPPPQITSVAPVSGGIGTQVTITGSNFQATQPSYAYVYFNGAYTSSVVSWNSTQIVVAVPAGSTTGAVKVCVSAGCSNQDVEFTLPNPLITALSPSAAPSGTQVQISGSGFGATQGSSTIAFNVTNATVVSWSDAQIVATVPSGATTGPVKVTEGGVPSNTNLSFTVDTVAVNSISPRAGPTGTQVTVSGSGFGASQGSGTISFNGTNATSIASWSDAQIVATVPAAATTGPVKVVNSGVASNTTVNFTVGTVVVTSVSPASGLAGTQLQVNGSGFGSTQGSGSVSINAYNAYNPTVVSWSSTQITVVAPNVATTGAVKVTAGGVASNTDINFTVLGPSVSNVSPTSGPTGTQVTVNGSNFGASQGSSTVSFNGANATNVSWSNTQITAAVPATASAGPVTVTVSYVASNATVYFNVPAPHITSISPTSGVVGTQVTINGSGFGASRGSSNVQFFSQLNASIVSWSDSQIVASVPAGATSGAVDVIVNGVYSNQDTEFSMPRPLVASLSPTTGLVGTQVQINGSGFGATQGASTIAFGSTNAAIVSWSDTQIVATVPSTATVSAAKVTEGGVASNANVYFTVPPPQITSISPASGVVGSQVTINGSGFQATQGSSFVSFFNGYLPTINSWSDTQIVATVGASTTTGPVIVHINNVASNQNVQFTVPNPVINSLSPVSGPVGTQVQVNGVGFGSSQGSSTVTFNGQAASVVSWSDTQVVAAVPSAATTGAVVVTEGGVASNANINFTVPAPQISSLSPSSGVVGTQVTINGSGFQANQRSSSVTFNGYFAAVTSWNDTQIVATVPSTVTGPVRVYVNYMVSNQNVEFTMPNPFITGLAPSIGPAGTQIQINGSGFGATQGTSTITFRPFNSIGGNAAVASWSDSQIVATVPVIAMSGPVTVTVGGVSSNTDVNFTVPAPQITSVSPNVGGAGNTVTIAGSGFGASQLYNGNTVSSVSFSNGSYIANVSSWSGTQIVATVPTGTTTGPVKATVNGQYSNLVNYTIPNNVVTAVSPTSGPVGTQVTVTGAGFGATQGTSALTFNGQMPAAIASWNDTQVLATVPVTAATGPVAVTVNNVPSNITVIYTVPPPAITSMSPGGGVVGTTVTITGSGFQANQRNSTITFNGTAAAVSSWSDTQIVAAVPASATTGPLAVTVNSVSGSYISPFVVPNMTITALTPPSGPTGGTVTITGTGFGAGPCNNSGGLFFNSYAAGCYSWSDTSITVQVPSLATSGPVTVTRFNGVSNGVQFTVEGQATVTGISPSTGPVGTTVTVTGGGFGATQSSSFLQFWGGANATITSWSDTQIVATVPPGAVTGPVSVNVASVFGPTTDFVVSTTVQVTDSFGNSSSYTSEMLGGAWVGSSSTGSGCSSCTVRGTLSNTLDSNGNVLSHTDELGHVTSYTYDANFNLASQSAQLDSSTTVTTSYTYNSFGEPLTVTDPLGNVTTNTYDANGNLLTVTSPAPNGTTAASVTQFAYDTKGELTQITDPLVNVTKLAYNAVGLISTITDAQQNVTAYVYDQHGNRTSITDALNNQTTFAYDAGDRLTKITYPDTTFVSFAYDSRGRRTSVTDQNGKVTTNTYDDADRLTQVKDAANNVTQYAYDTENNLLSITDAANHATSFMYDNFGRVTKTTFPSALAETYIYDSVGNLTNKTDRNSHSILYVYDALNRLTHKGYPDATGVDYLYDLAGKIKQVSDPTGAYAMAYENMGRLIGTTTTYAFLTGHTFSNSYAYDAGSNRTSLTLPDATTDAYQYDTLNRLTKITDSVTGQFTFGYDGLSRRTALTRPNGVNTSYGYNSLSRLLTVLHQAGANTLDGASYAYDLAGNRTAKTNKLNSIAEQYTYDPLYQLTQVTQGATTTESYSFDAVGNRLSSVGVSSYSYNSSNELTSTSAASFTYDNNGNTLSKTDSTGTRTYGWDFENRLSSVVLPGSGGTATFKYDPFGRRVQKAFTQNSTTTTTNYLSDGANTIEELDANGNEVARYAQGSDIDEPLAMIRGGATSFYEQDGIGSVSSLSSATGTLANTYTYDAFGNLTGSTGSITNPFQYTGRDYDPETGLRYYRARYYDAAAGRFISEDPILFLGGGNNFYRYALNNPLLWIDPTGLKPGDKYGTCREAAIQALVDIFKTSVSEGLEYAGRIYLNRDGTCSYTAPNKGNKHDSSPGSCPWFTKKVGSYHTHGSFDPKYAGEEFSDRDLLMDNIERETGWLATPSGNVLEHQPWKDPIPIFVIGAGPHKPTSPQKPSPGVK